MTTFLRFLSEKDKDRALLIGCAAIRDGSADPRVFEVSPESFRMVPGAPFAYWVSERVRSLFDRLPSLESDRYTAKVGLQTGDDFRFVRLFWESTKHDARWVGFAKGGAYSAFYADINLIINWSDHGKEIKASNGSVIRNSEFYFSPGLTWSLVTTLKLSVRIMPKNCITSVIGPGVFSKTSDWTDLFASLAISNSKAFIYLVEMQLGLAAQGRKAYQVGTIARTPFPLDLDINKKNRLGKIANLCWSQKHILDSVNETSHAFILPTILRARCGDYEPELASAQLVELQAEIDDIAFDLYGFSDADRVAALGFSGAADEDASDATKDTDDSEEDDGADPVDQTDGLLSWAAGVAFGRFDWRMATGEREAPPEPEPFDPLPAKSPGMLPDDAEPFYAHSGILVDDQGHPNDLARLIEEVFARVEAPVPADVRRWLQRDFFLLHLKQYSKSRRKAPIYWPISTSSGSYTLWLYYPSLTSQTLYTAVNDFIEGPTGKLQQVEHDLVALRNKGSGRSAADEKSFEKLQALEAELIELRETILEIAPDYRPNHDDGVQISAAPLWRLFRHKPWQKILNATWEKLENGDYDWAHLAMAYWPDRVHEKCKTDKSLAIAHDLEDLYEEPEVQPGAKQGRKKTGGAA